MAATGGSKREFFLRFSALETPLYGRGRVRNMRRNVFDSNVRLTTCETLTWTLHIPNKCDVGGAARATSTAECCRPDTHTRIYEKAFS